MNKESIFDLITWYQKNKRDLPWRHTKDPYKIWISEVMLQQTRVETVIDYYNHFIEELPNITELSLIKEERLLKLWEGLGYYSRARNLQKCAKILVSQGKENLPNQRKELLSLPGIGKYTAGAILSIAYMQEEPAIDGNVIRVLSRIYKEKRDFLNKNVKEEYTNLLKALMKDFPSDDFTQSFIELGALICLPNGTPKCTECPLQSVCQAHQTKEEANYPIKKKKNPRKVVLKTVFVYTYEGTYQIQKRKEELLHGLYEFPSIDKEINNMEEYLQQHSIKYQRIQYLGEYKHIFSHIEWHMKAYQIDLIEKNSKKYATKEELIKKYSIPTAFQRILKSIKE
ncbi:MAG: A/G-specific adenine glycosylase [Bacilli bacterium]|nr:A/G-specific adenine glycosylase [Bacilli bacterium]